MPVQKFYVASTAPYKEYAQTFNSSGTWTCPVGTTSVDVFAVGGGGGGGGVYYATTSGYAVTGGGAGGKVVKKTVSVTPGTTYNIFVGAGGAGGFDTYSGQMGGYSAFNPSYTLINGIIHQPFGSRNNNRYINNIAGYSLSSPVPYNHASFSNTGSSTFNSYATTPFNNSVIGDPTKAFRLGSVSAGNYSGTYFWVPVKGSTLYTASGYFGHSSTTVTTANVRIEWYTSLYGSYISAGDGSQSNIGTSWVRLNASATSPSNATYALVRYQHTGTTGTCYVSGMQFEEGSLSTFKTPGFNTTSGKVVQNLGFIEESASSAIAAGGGGGQGTTNMLSGNWAHSGNYILRPEYSGAGGGGSFFDGTSKPMIGGNGTNYAGKLGQGYEFQIANYTTTDASLTEQANRIIFEGVNPGHPAFYNNGNTGTFRAVSPEEGFEGIYGAGGVGGRYGSMNEDSSVNGGGLDGRNSSSNTGAGGSGIFCQTEASYTVTRYGGAGGSGIVTLKWMGQA